MLSYRGTRKSYSLLLVVLLCFVSIGFGKALSMGSQWINIFLLGVMVLAYIGVIFFFNRKVLLAFYLLTIVNLDYIRVLSEPFNLTVDIMFSIILMFLALPLFLSGKLPWRKTPIQKAFLLYLAATLICVFLSVEPMMSLKRWLRYANYFFLICLFMDIVRDRATVEKFTRILIYSVVIPCLIGYYGLFAKTPSLIGENLRFIYGIDMMRIKSTLSHANTFGLYLSLIIPAIIGFLLRRKGRWGTANNFTLVALLLLATPMLYFTYSRIGWIVTGLAISLILIFQKRWHLLTIFPWLFGLILWRIPGLMTRWSDIIDTTQPDSLDWRWTLYVFSLKKFVHKPIFGSGPGTFLEYVGFGKGYSQHHLWIGSLIEVGIVGTVAMAILFIVVWAQLIKFARKKPTVLNFIVLAVFSVFMIISFAGDPFNVPSAVIYLWALISLVMAEYRLPGPEPANKVVST